MPATILNLSSNAELRTLLAEKMRRQQFKGSRFARWIAPNYLAAGGQNTAEEVVSTGPMGPKWTSAPIEAVDAFIQQGRTDMVIPVRSILTGLPKFGDSQLRGSEEPMAFTFRAVKINRWRKAVAPPVGMNRQKIKQWAKQDVMSASNSLMDWYRNFLPSNILSAILGGYSREVVAPVVNGGLGQAIVSHPNMIVAGTGRVAYTAGRPGTVGYENSCATAIDGLTNTAEDKMSVAFVRNLVFEANRSNIKPLVTKDGYEFYPIWMKDSAWLQLRTSAEFIAYAQSLTLSEMSKHPLGNGAVAIIDNAVIYVDSMLWNAYTNTTDALITSGLVEYGPRPTAGQRAQGLYTANTINALDTGTKAVCILVGQSMLSIGTGEEMDLIDDEEDYGAIKGMAIDMIKSIVRNETYDTLGITGLTAGDFYENTSSLVGVTYSPHALSYA